MREREGRSLLDRVEDRGTVIALDRSGRMYDSETLASHLEHWGTRAIDFVVGGPLGLHGDVIERADYGWSLSPLTFPHELVPLLDVLDVALRIP